MLGDITEREYTKALEARAYVDDIIKRVEKRLNKYQDEHEQGFNDYSDKIRKLTHELEILERLKDPQCELISLYKQQTKSAPTEEELKAQWERDNGEAD
jgi:polyhydroxyalkanoate synthesis regulator phasin